MTQSVSVAIVSSALMKLGKSRHNLSSLMTHDLSFAWLPAPQPPWPWDTLEGHRQGRLCPSLLGVGEGLSPTAHVEQKGASGQFSQPHTPPALAHTASPGLLQ